MEISEDLEDQTNELKALGISIVDQFSLEQNVAAQVDEAVKKQNRKQKLNMLYGEVKESKLEIIKIKNKENDLEQRLSGMRQRVTDPRQILAVEKSLKENQEQLSILKKRKNYIECKLAAAAEDQSVLDTVDLNLEEGEVVDEDGTKEEKFYREIYQDKMIKEGKMTPFGTLLNSGVPLKEETEKPSQDSSNLCLFPLSNKSSLMSEKKSSLEPKKEKIHGEFEKYLQDQINKQKYHNKEISNKKFDNSSRDSRYGVPRNRKANLIEFSPEIIRDEKVEKMKNLNPLKRRILHPKRHWKEKNLGSITSELESDLHKTVPKTLLSERVAFVTSQDDEMDSGSEYIPSGEENQTEEEMEIERSYVNNNRENYATKRESREKRVKKSKKVIDDSYLKFFIKRIQKWKKEKLKEKHRKILSGEDFDSDSDEEFERFEGNYKIPLSIWSKLFKYQRVCVKWLWELHCQQCGGILGDEMGLGKTIMVISFLIGLSFSELYDPNRGTKGLGPVLIVSPATVLHQWVKEFHKWWPPFRVAILHDSGGFRGKKSALIHSINEHGGILITSYRGIVDNLKVLLNYDWHYIILDEGHKIRNPEAQITVAVKRFQTPHKLILSGSPIQNGLKELWSLFDFIFPGKLGTLPVFLQQFAVPITQGGYANASKLEVQTAFKCATVLRDTISPYLLRRMKLDVKNHLSLPNKNEQVLFCGLTEEQRSLYRHYLDGNEVKNIMNGRLQVFVGLINLRKICNHPDLHDGGPKHFVNEDVSDLQPYLQYGWFKRSGKMIVLHSILKLWKKQRHKVLLFTQSRQMLCILEKYLRDESYDYLKMDGGTSVGSRQSIIDKFNNTPSVFVFLLTTRVGGLGVNLTGADRVVIFDPDWNPSTDTQARERAWRIGQKRHVTIYRLLTAGTIEEKIYHRQIFKQFLTNRVLKDPKQQRFFKTNDLYELFTLNEAEQEKTESAAIFAGTGSEIIVKAEEKKSNRNTLINKGKKKGNEDIKNASCNNSIGRSCKPDLKKGYNICNNKQILDNIYVKTETVNTFDHFVNADTESVKSGVDNQHFTNPSNDENSKSECNKKRIKNDEKRNEESQIQTENFQNELEKKEQMMALAKLLSEKISRNKLELNNGKNTRTSFKREKLKKKEKKDKKGKKFEGERIENLIKKRKYKYSSDEKEDDDKLNKSQDDFVLQKLFKRSGVHTALSHDVILEAGDPDYLLLESEAERVASEALKQVRMSRARCLQTWQRDGHSNGMKKNFPKFGGKRSNLISTDSKGIKKNLCKNTSHKMFSDGYLAEDENEMLKDFSSSVSSSQMTQASFTEAGTSSGLLSSAQLLKRMRERNRTSISLGHSSTGVAAQDDQLGSDSTLDSYDPRYPSTAIYNNNTEIDPYIQQNVDLLTDIRNFIAFQASIDGQASTDEVVERFRERVPTNQSHIFKALLKQICDFVRDFSGKGFWYIKEEFR